MTNSSDLYEEYQVAARRWLATLAASALHELFAEIKARPRSARSEVVARKPTAVSEVTLTSTVLQALAWQWTSFSALRAYVVEVRPGTTANTLSTTVVRLVKAGKVEPRDVDGVREYRAVGAP
jgi:hypothetical protein